MSSETWKSIQEHKRRQENLRERLKRRRERQGLDLITATQPDKQEEENVNAVTEDPETTVKVVTSVDPKIEQKLQQYMCLSTHVFPMDSEFIRAGLLELNVAVSLAEVEFLLQKQAAQEFIIIKSLTEVRKGSKMSAVEVTSIELDKLTAVAGELKQPRGNKKHNETKGDTSKPTESKTTKSLKSEKSHKRSTSERSHDKRDLSREADRSKVLKTEKSKSTTTDLDDIQALLSTKSTKEQDTTRIADEIQELLNTASTKELTLAEKFRSMGGSQVREFCPYATREECLKHNRSYSSCQKLHFRKILKPHTDESLGDCSFLNTCFHMDTCKYVHYEIDYRGTDLDPRKNRRGGKRKEGEELNKGLLPKFDSDSDYIDRKMLPPQWINCDIRYLDISILGKFSVIMADPPWDIHMELPYGTMQDSEMRALRIQDLSDDGLMFLWVTGRAMELGRELFDCWGYKRCDELIWVKTNQLQRLIRTGRTGHWLNHGKEHCLVGIKGNPKSINRRLDCDVLVAEVRATSHKPDEIYGIIERLSPGTRKLELFGRMHNIQPNWITLGNQLDGVHLTEYDVVEKFRSTYPDGKVTKPKPPVEAVESRLEQY
ncbi:unnamed protein product [Clavelina lepadiformis]|uniref:mRNA m(6)A methyltransferase n=1 Tax=Clavelina lepadiformis TaxID=159417 RepID=A0ABP0GWR3_CLALP